MTETELKLEILPADFEILLGSALLGDAEGVVEQHSIYFDTTDHRLRHAGFSLRIRRSEDELTQTVKATGTSASLFARSEWETTVSGNLPVLDHSSPLLNEFGSLATELLPHFEVSTQRHIWNITENDTKIEVVIDNGVVKASDRQTPVLEVELELKDGNASDLFVFARKIEAIVPFKFGVLSKSDRGFRLLQALPTVSKAEPIELESDMASAEAFQTIAGSCFRQFRLNEAILLQKKNAESLHQARVALRRLRSLITLFKPLLQDETAARLSGEFRWLAGVLGEARDLDVLLPKADELRDRLVEVRSTAYDEAIEALGSFRARALMLDFNEWLRCGNYLKVSADEVGNGQRPTALEFASEALDRTRRKLKKHGRDLSGIDDEHRHEARKDAKKMRYAAEFFGSIFSGKRSASRYRRFISAIETLQDRLGSLNDLASGPDILDKHGLRDHPEADMLISHADKATLIRKAQTALDDVLDAKRFWR